MKHIKIYEELHLFKTPQEELNLQLIKACYENDNEKIQKLIHKGADIETKDDGYTTPLMIMCSKGNFDAVKYLIDKGADVNKENNGKESPIFYAVDNGSMSICEYLISKGVNVNHKNRYGCTPLIYSVVHDNIELTIFLINKGSDIESKDEDDETCLDINEKIWKKYEVQKALVEKDIKNIHKLTKHNIPIHPHIKKEYPEETISNELGFFENKENYDFFDFYTSAMRGDLDRIKKIVKGTDVDVNDKNVNGRTILMFAAMGGHLDVINYLIYNGANINAMSNIGNTALIYASSVGELKVMVELVRQGSDITITNGNGYTCLDYSKELWEKYELQKIIMFKNPNWIRELKKHKIPIHSFIKEDYPEETISDELGFFN